MMLVRQMVINAMLYYIIKLMGGVIVFTKFQIVWYTYWIIFHVLACCLYGHRSRRRMSIGVLGSPRKEFRGQQTCLFISMNGKVLTSRSEYNNLHYTTLFPFCRIILGNIYLPWTIRGANTDKVLLLVVKLYR